MRMPVSFQIGATRRSLQGRTERLHVASPTHTVNDLAEVPSPPPFVSAPARLPRPTRPTSATADRRKTPAHRMFSACPKGQGRKDSNLQPPVLETIAARSLRLSILVPAHARPAHASSGRLRWAKVRAKSGDSLALFFFDVGLTLSELGLTSWQMRTLGSAACVCLFRSRECDYFVS